VTAGPRREEPLLFERVPGSFEQRRLSIEPGADLAYDESTWRDSIVQVEAGEIELECASGCCRLFGRGDVFWLDGISVRALRNPGHAPAVLVAVSRLR
jgi:quercetin dioxygenase-like cupin family protein